MSRTTNEDDEEIYTLTVVNPTTPPFQKRKVVEAMPETTDRTSNPLSSPSAADLVRSLKF
jgi:hypothetical protein